MPFYLVTQTSLIEADDENAAAQKAIDQIRSGKQVTVSVKFDETTLSHIVVPAKSEAEPGGIVDREAFAPMQEHNPDHADVAGSVKRTGLKRIMTDALKLMKWQQ
jgi:hypothetical protein